MRQKVLRSNWLIAVDYIKEEEFAEIVNTIITKEFLMLFKFTGYFGIVEHTVSTATGIS